MKPGRTCDQCTTGERLYLVGSTVGLLVGLCFALYEIIQDHFDTTDSCYLFIFAVNCCFALIYTIKGIKHEDPYDLMILVLSVAPPVFFIVIDYALGHQSALTEVRLILGVPFALFIGGFGIYHLWRYLRSKQFMARYGIPFSPPQRGGAVERTDNEASIKQHEELRRCLRTMLLFYFLLSVNLQCDLSAAVFTLTSGYAIELQSGIFIHPEMFILFFAVVVIASVACIFGYLSQLVTPSLWLSKDFLPASPTHNFKWIFGIQGAKYESKWVVFFFGVTSAFLVAAGLYLLVQSAEDIHKTDTDHTLSRVALFTSVLMVFVRIITCTGCYLAYQNFGKGLKQAVYGSPDPEQSPLVEGSTRRNPGFTDSSIQYD